MFNTAKGNRMMYCLRVLLLLISLSSFSQHNLYKNFSVKDGLPSSEVYEMLQASDGYLWFATDMGVSRFNGYEFKNFSTENGLPDNTLYGIYEDYKHNIWFRSQSGKLSYFRDNKIHTLPCNKELETIFQLYIVTSIYVDTGDTLWIGCTSNFVVKIGPGRTPADIKKIPLSKRCVYIYEVSGGFVFGGGTPKENLVVLYKKGLPVISIKDPYDPPIASRVCVKMLRNGDYYVSCNQTTFRFNNKGLKYIYENDKQNICALEDETGNIITGTYKGIRILGKNGYMTDSSFKPFDQRVVTTICKDRENELWICTKGQGIFYIPYLNFKYYAPETGLSESSISCLSIMDNHVMAGHLDGQVSVFNEQGIKKVDFGKTNILSKVDEVTDMLDYSEDVKLISTIQNIYAYNPKNNSVKRVLNRGLKKMLRSKRNTLTSLAFRRVLEYSIPDFDTLDFVPLNNFADNIYEDHSGKLWICTSNGLWTLKSPEGLTYAGKKDSLLASRVVDVKEGSNGIMWMATRGKGVILKKGDKLMNITSKNGLSGNMCRTLFIDSGNVIWVGTNNGLNKISIESFEPLKYSLNTYSTKAGLLTNEVNYIVKFKNKLWLAHNNGISVFDPNYIKDNSTPPPVYITNVLVNEKNVDTANVFKLKYNENYLTINYNGLSFKDPGHIDYKYKLIGLDTNWIFTTYTSVKFQSLPPAEYLFVVYAKNNDGYWSELPAVFHFTIHPAWWQTWWFTAVVILFIMGLVIAAFIYRLRIFKRRERLKMIHQTKLSNAELKALRSQMNPHFIFNAINSVQYFITNNDPASSQRYLSKFAKLIRYVVDNSKPVAIPLIKELDALNLYLDLESLRFENKFEYSIDINKNVDVESIQIPSMLIQPYVENAIWHGLMHKETKGRINISIETKKNVLICIIEDNGIGRKRSGEILKAKKNEFHKSVGMSITKERLDIINRKNNSNLTITIIDLENDAGESLGTRVELNLPFY